LAGKDLEGGGTWLGNAPGRFAGADKNISRFQALAKGAAARGALALDYLAGRSDPH